ncbi:MAG: hypothetical protein JKY96_09100, partial [Phycisphaerales bacterium]|nr:hypothetical protein [Phycisphaerales bacterium]
ERINNDYAVHLARQCGDIPAEFEAVPVDEIPGQPECEAKSTPEPTIEPEPAAAPPAEQAPVQAA